MTSSTTPGPSPRVALVTGANKGVGRAIAHELGKLGYTVYLGARNEERGKAVEADLRTAGMDARYVRLDVTDETSIALAAKHIEQDSGRLDALVNNAGISTPWRAPSQTPLDEVRRTFETNVFGYIAVTNAMLPLLRRSHAARIVNITSVIGSLSAAADPQHHEPPEDFPDGKFPVILSHSVSKAAVNSLTLMYANELRDEGILVNAVSPNWVPTDANGHTGNLTPEQGAAMPVRMATLPDGGPTGTFTSSSLTGDGIILPW